LSLALYPLLTVGADARVTTHKAQPVVGFVVTNSGLMGKLSLGGSRITPLNLNSERPRCAAVSRRPPAGASRSGVSRPR